MQYKTMTLELLQQRPQLYHALRTRKTLLPTLDIYAHALQARHRYWIQQLDRTQPPCDPGQRSSQARELALQDLQDALPLASIAPAPEPLSLDALMAFLHRRTPPA